MNIKLRDLAAEPELAEPASLGTPDGGAQTFADSGNVAVSYGIHRGRYPIAGMLVGEAREALRRLINIDDDAIAVINGAPVEEGQTIAEGVTLLSFVKPSAMKGCAAAWYEHPQKAR